MTPVEWFQSVVAQVPELVQPLIVALAGAVPFIEGEGAVAIGIIGGINPIVAAVAAMAGNFLCVTVLVLLSSRARTAVVSRTRQRSAVPSTGGSSMESGEGPAADRVAGAPDAAASPRSQKFQRAFERYGVPGVSLLGPLLLPTQFTATMLAAAGIGRARILVWQAVAIFGWTTLVALLISGVLNAVG
ncbi:MAG: small multidrug efflux protein [Microbacterium pygmaeum]